MSIFELTLEDTLARKNSNKIWFFARLFVPLSPILRNRYLGLTGFDSGLRWYVSTRRLVGSLLNLSQRTINWRKQVRSRCLIEVQ